MVVFGQIWLYLGKFVFLGKIGCIWENCLYLGKTVLFSHKIDCIPEKWLYLEKSDCIRAKLVVHLQSGSLPVKCLYSGKVVVFGQK